MMLQIFLYAKLPASYILMSWAHLNILKQNFLLRVLNTSETLQGVLGSGENGVQKYREQGAWGQKDQGAGSKGE